MLGTQGRRVSPRYTVGSPFPQCQPWSLRMLGDPRVQHLPLEVMEAQSLKRQHLQVVPTRHPVGAKSPGAPARTATSSDPA